MFDKTIKINHLSSGYWLVPSFLKIFSARKSQAVIKHSKTLEGLLEKNNLMNDDFTISLNGDKQFKMFNQMAKLKELPFFINNEVLNKIDKEGYVDFEVIPNLILRYTFKSLQAIYAGYIPFYSKQYFAKLYNKVSKHNPNQTFYFEWTSFFSYSQLSEKKLKKQNKK